MSKYLWNILISLDQLILNVVLSPLWNWLLKPYFKFGNPDETMSSVMGKNNQLDDNKCKGCIIICKMLSFLQISHCLKSIEKDEENIV